MQIHEFQVKRIFQDFGIPILKGAVAYTPTEAKRCAQDIGGQAWYVKAQVYSQSRAQGRFIENTAGKGGGIRTADSPEAVSEQAGRMLLNHMTTPTTGKKPLEVKKIYIEEAAQVQRAFRFSICMDFVNQKIVLTGVALSDTGELKGTTHSVDLHLEKPLPRIWTMSLLLRLGVPKNMLLRVFRILQSLYDLFKKYSAFEVQLDPLVLCERNRWVALGGSIEFDPDAIPCYKEIESLRDLDEETSTQRHARQNNFRYIKLQGNIGCLINGSGLGMATLDLIHQYEGRPACLLDIGATSTKEGITYAFKEMLCEPDIEGILINIFGASARCDTIAEALVSAAQEISVGMPIVVRMDGTNAQIGCRILFESGLPFIVKNSMDEAVECIVQSVREIV